MKYIITESKFKPIFRKLLNNLLFNGFDEIEYNWADYDCGMGVCCDPYAIGFALPDSEHYDYLFKLVHWDRYEPYGRNYPKELSDTLPEVCEEMPNINDPNFDTIIFSETYIEEIEEVIGNRDNWKFSLLEIINETFHCNATRLMVF
jgi:hypothetical protein